MASIPFCRWLFPFFSRSAAVCIADKLLADNAVPSCSPWARGFFSLRVIFIYGRRRTEATQTRHIYPLHFSLLHACSLVVFFVTFFKCPTLLPPPSSLVWEFASKEPKERGKGETQTHFCLQCVVFFCIFFRH